MINRMKPTPPDDPFKKGKADEMDDEKKRIEKAREVDPEERKKFKKYIKEEEKAEKKEESKKYTPYDPKFHGDSIDKKKSDKKKTIDQSDTSFAFEKKSFEKSDVEVETSAKIEPEKTPLQHPKQNAKEVKVTTPLPPKPEERIEQQGFERKDQNKPESFPKEEEKEIKTISLPLELPIDITQRVSEITSDLKVYLNPEIAPLFEQMVGRMIIMTTQEGIMQTEIELTSESFENSVFYGSKILIEKYATAPDSFNIQLTGPPEAVAIFNAHLNPLMESFRRTDLNFRIGRLEAVYETEKPLFKRKKPPTSEGGESKSFH